MDEANFDQDQYEMLLRYSKAGDIKEWTKWRKEHPDKKIIWERSICYGQAARYHS